MISSQPYSKRDNEFIAWYPCALEPSDGQEIWQAHEAAFYVHFPFCRGICDYCGYAVEHVNTERMHRYVSSLVTEIQLSERLPTLQKRHFTVGHFGGGTPSLIDMRDLERIINSVRDSYNLECLRELTLEANPSSLTIETARKWLDLGFNRLSIGVQSFNSKILRNIGRRHREGEAYKAYDLARRAGFDNISIDLMYGLPGQTCELLIEDLKTVTELEADHVTCFCLEVIPLTPLEIKNRLGTLKQSLPTLEEINNMHEIVEDVLGTAGYVRYGCLSHARDGKQSEHNRIAFRAPQREYIGWGNSAYSFIDNYVFCNDCNVERYCDLIETKQSAVTFAKKASMIELASRYIVLGLKFFEVLSAPFLSQFGFSMDFFFGEQLKALSQKGLIEVGKEGIRVTDLGKRYINNVCKEFYVGANIGRRQHIQFEPTISAARVNWLLREAQRLEHGI